MAAVGPLPLPLAKAQAAVKAAIVLMLARRMREDTEGIAALAASIEKEVGDD